MISKKLTEEDVSRKMEKSAESVTHFKRDADKLKEVLKIMEHLV